MKEVQLFFRKICVYLGLYFLFMYQDCCMYRVLDVTISHSWLINPPRFIWKREYDFWEICFIFKFLKLLEIYKQILVSFNTNAFGKLSLLSKLITNFWFTFCQFINRFEECSCDAVTPAYCLTCMNNCIWFYCQGGRDPSYMDLKTSYFTSQKHESIWNMSLIHQN